MKIIVDDISEGTRLDVFLSEISKDISRSKIQASIKNGQCLVNSKVVKPSYSLRLNDNIEFKYIIPQNELYLPENIDIDIAWEDENMLVVNKPSGILTHPTAIEKSGTLVNALLYKYGENLSDINGEFRRGIVHRLDRNTSGLLMVAKNNNTHEFLVDEMKQKHFIKKYITIVKGKLDEDEFEITSPIGRHPTQPNKMSTLPNSKDLKESLTKVKVLERFKDATLAEITLVTGRTHQIRVHMASIGHPVYNDTLYGFGKMKIKTDEQVLESYKLEFTQPFTENRIQLEIPYDEKIQKVLNFLYT